MFFSTNSKKKFCCQVTFIFSSANALNLEQSKNLPFGKGLRRSFQKIYVVICSLTFPVFKLCMSYEGKCLEMSSLKGFTDDTFIWLKQ